MTVRRDQRLGGKKVVVARRKVARRKVARKRPSAERRCMLPMSGFATALSTGSFADTSVGQDPRSGGLAERELQALMRGDDQPPAREVGGTASRPGVERRHLPDERPSVTKKIKIRTTREDRRRLIDLLQKRVERARRAPDKAIADAILGEPVVLPAVSEELRLYVQVGLYPDTGEVGEIFIKADRMGSSMSGLLDALSMAVSVGLQSGVPLQWFVDKMRNMQFEPAGAVVGDPDLRRATSVVDAVARWLEKRFLKRREQA